MNDYARAKGSSTAAPASRVPRMPAPQLPAAEQERVSRNRAVVQEQLPELVPFIKELYAEGMIDGWRAVTACRGPGRNQHSGS